MTRFLTLLLFCLSWTARAQTDSTIAVTPTNPWQWGLKITPSQFAVREKAVMVELIKPRNFSAEVKLGYLGRLGNDSATVFDNALTLGKGFVGHIGFKKYFASSILRTLFSDQERFYFQTIGFYKRTAFDASRVCFSPGTDGCDFSTTEAQKINTAGLKFQAGMQGTILFDFLYYEVYAGLSYRYRYLVSTNYEVESGSPFSVYGMKRYEKQHYPSPQAGINLGILLPFK